MSYIKLNQPKLVEMKKFFLTQLLLLIFSFYAFNQSIEITPYGGFQWGGKVQLRYGEAKFKASGNYGVTLTLLTPNYIGLQLDFCHQPTYIEHRDNFPSTFSDEYKANIYWYQIGGIKQVPVSDLISVYGGLTFGTANLRVSEVYPEIDEWAFAMIGQIGTKIFITERIGMQLHFRMLMPVQWGGFNFYFNSDGPGTSVNAGSYFVQGDLGGGLIIRLGN